MANGFQKMRSSAGKLMQAWIRQEHPLAEGVLIALTSGGT